MWVPGAACMAVPPARSAPKSRPASTVPRGRERPRSATVMASKPMVPTTDSSMLFWVPRTGAVAASPHRAPEIIMTRLVTQGTLMPAVRAASALRPVARSWKPRRERSMSHHTATATSRARRNPAWRRKESPASEGYWAASATVRDLRLPVSPSPLKALRLSTWDSRWAAMELSMIVTITSLAPVRALRTPAMPPHTSPPRAAPTTASSRWATGGRFQAMPT